MLPRAPPWLCAAAVLVALLCFSASGDAARVKAVQESALLKVRTALRLANSTVLASWKSGSDCSAWRGVACDSKGNVKALILLAQYLYSADRVTDPTFDVDTFPISKNGSLSPHVTELKYLETLIFYNVGVQGRIPKYIGNLTKLTYLDLSYNKFSVGGLPDSLGTVPKLEVLTCNNCGLKGKIPDGLGNLKKLRVLDLGTNKLRGGIPSGIGKLPNITWLVLQNNQLSGKIPNRSSKLPELNVLVLNDNKFTGTIPEWVFTGPLILLNNNRLVGRVPILASYIFVLLLNTNYLSGEVIITGSGRGSSFDIANNYFTYIDGGPSEVAATGNCLFGNSTQTFGDQKSEAVCDAFCNATQPGGPCGPYGVCMPGGAKGPTCACKKGYYTFANKFTCTRGHAPPPPPL